MLKQRVTQAGRWPIKLVLLSLALVVLLPGISISAQRRRGKLPVKPRPPVVAIDAAGLQALLKRDNGKPLLVNYWATWCVPCRQEFPDLVKVDAEYRSKGLDFIAVTLDDLADIKKAVPLFLSQMKAQMPVYLLNMSDPEPAINMIDPKWGGALPATFLYNAKGEVVYKSVGGLKINELREALNKVMSEK